MIFKISKKNLFNQFFKKYTHNFILFRCRRLPKALKDWQAYDDLKKQIDGFNDLVPMLELMIVF